MRAYYNDHEPYCCKWLRNLIKAGELPEGVVDGRPVQEVTPAAVDGFDQCHFFAGIGGWAYALRLAGWSESRPVWTASLPCQPFSTAGKGRGEEDERHLWPVLLPLVRQLRPPVLFGEQVASDDGRAWLDRVFADLEQMAYACGAADLPAACVGAPHQRQRLFWVAESLADAEGTGGRPHAGAVRGGAVAGVSEAEGQDQRRAVEQAGGPGDSRADGGLDDSDQSRQEGRGVYGRGRADQRAPGETGGPPVSPGQGAPHAEGDRRQGQEQRAEAGQRVRPPPVRPGWGETAVLCRDGFYRRVSAEPGVFGMADGLSQDVGPVLAGLGKLGHGPDAAARKVKAARRNRTGRLMGYGNAIVPEAAALFVRAYMAARGIEL